MFSTNKQKWLVSLWHDYLLFGVRVVLEPVVVIAFIYLMYRVLSLPTWDAGGGEFVGVGCAGLWYVQAAPKDEKGFREEMKGPLVIVIGAENA